MTACTATYAALRQALHDWERAEKLARWLNTRPAYDNEDHRHNILTAWAYQLGYRGETTAKDFAREALARFDRCFPQHAAEQKRSL